MLFPLVALGHIIWLLLLVWNVRAEPMGSYAWIDVYWMLAFTACWIGVSDLRKWGAIGYVLLTIVNITIFLAVKDVFLNRAYRSSLFEVHILLCFFLLVYFKRFK